MAMMGLLPMAAKKLRKKGYRPLAMLSPAAMAMGMHKRDKMKSMKSMKRGGMNPGLRALKKEAPEVVKRMGYMYGGKVKKMMGGGKVMKYSTGGMAFKSKCDGKAIQGRTKGRMV
tara:strand:- start:1660 stop:2004 length:345 start_codon:yes stop_codon:yes gene_type:complete